MLMTLSFKDNLLCISISLRIIQYSPRQKMKTVKVNKRKRRETTRVIELCDVLFLKESFFSQ